MSTTWFVGADWLAEHIDDPEIQIIDARMASPGQEDRNVAQEYLNGHIPGAVFFDIEALSDHTSPLPHMLPRPETFAVAMRELGVNQDKHLIVYDEGNLFSAPRAWWMLRTFGVEKVSILGGGLAGWQRDDLLLEEGAVELPEGEFNAAFNPGVEFYSNLHAIIQSIRSVAPSRKERHIKSVLLLQTSQLWHF